MWTLACSIMDKYADLKHLFYQRARKYVEADYVKGYGEHIISVAHCQTHILLACYEMKMMYFPRAWINTGAAVRLCQMIGLHRLDGAGLDVKQCLPPPGDWTEREEWRRTFWMAFCEDRYASIGTGWPMTIDERDVMTRLPASEDAFDLSRPEHIQTLAESMSPSGAAKLSSFGAVVLLACIFGRNLVHLHRPDDDDLDDDLDGCFWKRHRHMDNMLLNTSLCLPAHLRLPAGLSSPNVVFANMSIHNSTICLHQAAIFKADKNRLGASVGSESRVRCMAAANDIASIMRTISHMDLSAANPFISFCLYVAARVFVQHLRNQPDDAPTTDSLRFLLSAMQTLKRRNPLTELFLVQLDVDFEALAARIPKLRGALPRSGDGLGPPRPPDRATPPGARRPGLASSGSGATAASCDEADLVRGMLAHPGDCDFLEVPDKDDGADGSGAFGQPWLSADQSSMPVLTPFSGTEHDRNGSTLSGLGDTAETRQSPEADPSSGPTPKSSGAGSDGRVHVGPGRMGGAPGRQPSFRAGPLSPQQGMLGPGAGMDVEAFFGGPGGFDMMAAGMGRQQGAAGLGMVSGGWPELGGQASGMPPLGEGVLRALMNMGPMDAMDLSSWDSGHDTHMRG